MARRARLASLALPRLISVLSFFLCKGQSKPRWGRLEWILGFLFPLRKHQAASPCMLVISEPLSHSPACLPLLDLSVNLEWLIAFPHFLLFWGFLSFQPSFPLLSLVSRRLLLTARCIHQSFCRSKLTRIKTTNKRTTHIAESTIASLNHLPLFLPAATLSAQLGPSANTGP